MSGNQPVEDEAADLEDVLDPLLLEKLKEEAEEKAPLWGAVSLERYEHTLGSGFPCLDCPSFLIPKDADGQPKKGAWAIMAGSHKFGYILPSRLAYRFVWTNRRFAALKWVLIYPPAVALFFLIAWLGSHITGDFSVLSLLVAGLSMVAFQYFAGQGLMKLLLWGPMRGLGETGDLVYFPRFLRDGLAEVQERHGRGEKRGEIASKVFGGLAEGAASMIGGSVAGKLAGLAGGAIGAQAKHYVVGNHRIVAHESEPGKPDCQK